MTNSMTSAVRFADINGDGQAKYLWVSDTGAVRCYLSPSEQDTGPMLRKETGFLKEPSTPV